MQLSKFYLTSNKSHDNISFKAWLKKEKRAMNRKFTVAIIAALVVVPPVSLFASGDGEQDVELGDPEEFREQFLEGELGWDEVVARAQAEGEVEFYHWGGSEELNNWIELTAKPGVEENGIELNTNRADTPDVVDIILADDSSGRGLGEGSVDFVWINGENFRTLKDNDLLFGPFADKLPSSEYYYLDPDDPRSNVNLFDFGTSTDLMEMPWSSAQYTFRIDTERISPEEVPAGFEGLEEWIREHPGRFTYVAPPDYIGSTFVQTIAYDLNPEGTSYEPFQRDPSDFTPEELSNLLEPAFDYLRRIEPYLLGASGDEENPGSPSYPADGASLEGRFVGGEVDFAMEFGIYDVDRDISSGHFPETVENVIFPESGMIANKSFLAIPSNAPNPAAALVAVNELSTPESHVSKLVDIGYALGVDAPLLPEDMQQQVEEEAPDLRGVTAEELSEAEVPDTNARLVDVIDEVWLEYIAEQSDRSFDAVVEDVWESIVQ